MNVDKWVLIWLQMDVDVKHYLVVWILKVHSDSGKQKTVGAKDHSCSPRSGTAAFPNTFPLQMAFPVPYFIWHETHNPNIPSEAITSFFTFSVFILVRIGFRYN